MFASAHCSNLLGIGSPLFLQLPNYANSKKYFGPQAEMPVQPYNSNSILPTNPLRLFQRQRLIFLLFRSKVNK